VATIALAAVWTICLYFYPYLQAFDVKDVVTFSWESLDSLVFLEVSHANIAFVIAKVSVSLQKYDSRDFAEILIVIGPYPLQLWW
jgi:hypothetical protein